MSRLLRLLAVLLAPSTLAAQALPPAATVHRLADSLARAFVAAEKSPSVAIGIVRGSDTVTLAAYGMADLENGIAATARSVYRIGSVTKQFTAAMIMQLVEGDSLNLDDPIGGHLDSLPAAWQPVTVRQLLNHTSGIPSYTALGPEWMKRWGEEMTPEAIVALTADKPMDFSPGTDWRYDNTGYVLLGMLIEKATGQTWAAALQTRLAEPLGLTDTRECLTTPIIPRRVRGYDRNAGAWVNTQYLAMSQPYAAGAMCSTVHDLARWNRALHSGKVVSEESYRLMVTPDLPSGVNGPGYGFGLMQDMVAGRTMISHGGGIHGFNTANAWVPSAELSVSVLTNSGGAPAPELLQQLALVALGQPLPTRPPVVSLAANERDRYVGVFTLNFPGAGQRTFTVALADTGLSGTLEGQQPVPMLYFGNDTFGVNFDPSVRLTFTVRDGRAMSMTLEQRGRTVSGERTQ